MKKTNLSALAFLALLGFGCTLDEAGIAPKMEPLPTAPAPVRTATQAEANFSVASEVSTKLHVTFNYDPAEATFCAKLAQRLAGQVILDKAEIVFGRPGDLSIMIRPEFELLDKSREYCRINCTEVAVAISSKQKIYAMTTVTPKALPRKLGAQNAKNQYLPQVTAAVAPFLKAQLEKISREQVAVSEVEFALANVQEQPEARVVAVQVARITRILNTTPGIINFTNIRQDVSKAACSFRVVYLKNEFPEGISNALNLKLAGK